MTVDEFFAWLLADLTDSDSAPPRDDDREPSNSVASGSTARGGDQ